MGEITIFIQDNDGTERPLQVPLGISMTLMEALKAYDEPIEATCGGMALCATCLVAIVNGLEQTGSRTEDEEAMLDSLPDVVENCRLTCQINITEALDGLRIRYIDEADLF